MSQMKNAFLYSLFLGSFCWLLTAVVPVSVLGDGQVHPVPPSLTYWLGTTAEGQSVLGILGGAILVSLSFLWVAVPLVFMLSVSIGIFFDFHRRLSFWIPLERVIEILNSIPMMMLLVILSYYQWLSWSVFLMLVLFFKWTFMAQIAQGLSSQISQQPFMRQAKRLGMTDWDLFKLYLYPPVARALIPKLSVVGISLFNYMTVLEFLGHPLLSEEVSLGGLIAKGKESLYAPWILAAGLMGVVLVLVPFVWMSWGKQGLPGQEGGANE